MNDCSKCIFGTTKEDYYKEINGEKMEDFKEIKEACKNMKDPEHALEVVKAMENLCEKFRDMEELKEKAISEAEQLNEKTDIVLKHNKLLKMLLEETTASMLMHELDVRRIGLGGTLDGLLEVKKYEQRTDREENSSDNEHSTEQPAERV